jgi:hypothetical protein
MCADADAQAERALIGCLHLVLSIDKRLRASGTSSSERKARSRAFHSSMREGSLGPGRRSG